jgi:hypothetical protein
MGRVRAQVGAPDYQRERERGTQGTSLSTVRESAPDLVLPRVKIKWTGRELESLADLVSAGEANRPTDTLIRAMLD